MTVTVTGAEVIKRVLLKLRDQYPEAFAAALYQEGLAIDADSAKEVPVDKGRLRQTHYVAPPTDVKNPVVEVGYGTDYAVYVHEMIELHHDNGKAKFLSDPLNRARNGYLRRVAARTIDNRKKGVGLDIRGSAPTSPAQGEDASDAKVSGHLGAQDAALKRTKGRQSK